MIAQLQADQDLQTRMQQHVMTPENVKNYLAGDEKLVQSLTDKRVTTAIDTWKQNNLETEIEKALVSRGYKETEEQKALRELRGELDALRKDKTMAELKTQAIGKLAEAGLPASMVDLVMTDTIEGVGVRIEQLKLNMDLAVTKAVDAKMASTGATGGEGGIDPKKSNGNATHTIESFMQLSRIEQNQFAVNNPEEFNKLMGI